MIPISVIIPTYKNPECLDLCIQSAILGETFTTNEIIVVVDGTYDLNKEILKKWGYTIKILNLEENVGTCRATNLGVFNATNDYVLIVNDDNVFPTNWDYDLAYTRDNLKYNFVVTPNQIEPYPSIFKPFIHKDFGTNTNNFKYEEFKEFSKTLRRDNSNTVRANDGYTFPIFIRRLDFLKIGGFDESYPSQAGYVADWEFFIKAELNGFEFYRDYGINFYHFVSVTSKSPESVEKSRLAEIDCHNYFNYKWGFPAFNRLLHPDYKI